MGGGLDSRCVGRVCGADGMKILSAVNGFRDMTVAKTGSSTGVNYAADELSINKEKQGDFNHSI